MEVGEKAATQKSYKFLKWKFAITARRLTDKCCIISTLALDLLFCWFTGCLEGLSAGDSTFLYLPNVTRFLPLICRALVAQTPRRKRIAEWKPRPCVCFV